MIAKECTIGNWQLINIKDDLWELHYTGDDWETVELYLENMGCFN